METRFLGLAPLREGSHVGVEVDGEYLDLHNFWNVESLVLRRGAVIEVLFERIGEAGSASLSFHGVEQVAQEGESCDGVAEDWALFGEIGVGHSASGEIAFVLEVGVVRLHFRAHEVRFLLRP